MSSIVNILEGFEKLTYRILIWVILIPKTIVKIILDPGFAYDYIKQELEEDRESPFDEYMSPMLLYLAITLLPALAIYLIPQFGVKLSSPIDGLGANRAVHLEAKTVFKSNTNKMGHEVEWQVWSCGNIDEQGNCKFDQYVISEKHNSADGVLAWNYDTGGYESTGNTANIQFVDQSTIQDSYDNRFDTPGTYLVYINVKNFQPNTKDGSVEEYFDSFYVYVPESPDEAVQIYGESNQGGNQEKKSYVENLQSTETIFLGLAMLFPPLLFALATNIFRGTSISETTLKESFYAQCYYWAPVGLAFWAAGYTINFLTNDMSNKLIFSALILFLITILWFIITETNAIARERQINKWGAFFILIACLVFMSGLVWLYTLFTSDYDILRKSAIWAYPIIGTSLVLTSMGLRIRKWVISRKARVNK